MLDLLTAAPVEIAFGAKTYRIGALKLKEFGLLQRWIREHAVRPSERLEVELKIHPEEMHRELRKQAAKDERENWPPPVGSHEGNRVLLGDDEGQRYFVKVMMGKYQPEISDSEVDELVWGMSPEDLGVLAAIAFGDDHLDPKEVAAAVRGRMRAEVQAATVPGDGTEPVSTGNSSSDA